MPKAHAFRTPTSFFFLIPRALLDSLLDLLLPKGRLIRILAGHRSVPQCFAKSILLRLLDLTEFLLASLGCGLLLCGRLGGFGVPV